MNKRVILIGILVLSTYTRRIRIRSYWRIRYGKKERVKAYWRYL